jgi:hypothetical protein
LLDLLLELLAGVWLTLRPLANRPLDPRRLHFIDVDRPAAIVRQAFSGLGNGFVTRAVIVARGYFPRRSMDIFAGHVRSPSSLTDSVRADQELPSGPCGLKSSGDIMSEHLKVVNIAADDRDQRIVVKLLEDALEMARAGKVRDAAVVLALQDDEGPQFWHGYHGEAAYATVVAGVSALQFDLHYERYRTQGD